MWRVSAIGSGHHNAAGAGCAAGSPVAARAAIHQAGANGQGGFDVTQAIPESGPIPCSLVYLRWKSCRPRRMARKGSRLMMNDEESGVMTLPRPAPACWENDLLIPTATSVPRLRGYKFARGVSLNSTGLFNLIRHFGKNISSRNLILWKSILTKDF